MPEDIRSWLFSEYRGLIDRMYFSALKNPLLLPGALVSFPLYLAGKAAVSGAPDPFARGTLRAIAEGDLEAYEHMAEKGVTPAQIASMYRRLLSE